jgi:cytochrome c oxidase cbb3-type subunit 3
MSHEKTDPIQGLIVHEYDGIEEADNHLPIWWLCIFFGAVAFGVLYWSYYEAWHFGPGTRELYAAEMAERLTAGGEVTDEMLTALSDESSIVATGRATFEANCVACHGDRGQGNIGPNLTDGVWIHGGAPTAIYATARDGVSSRGMPQWGPVLGERALQGVVAYVLSIRDTNLPGRAPEGEPYDPSVTAALSPSSTTATAPADAP